MCYADLDPRVRPLVVVAKNWAGHHTMLGTRHKRLNGYGMALLVIFYLQSKKVVPSLIKEWPKEFGLASKASF
jgi:DNA polymerase sigma